MKWSDRLQVFFSRDKFLRGEKFAFDAKFFDHDVLGAG
jgi:hypothetical protein